MDSQNPDHSDTSFSGESSSKLGIIALVCFVLPVLYILSIGPCAWALANRYISDQVYEYLETFYSPLGYFAENWEPFGQLLNRYVLLFGWG